MYVTLAAWATFKGIFGTIVVFFLPNLLPSFDLPDLECVELAEHEDGVEEHEEVASSHLQRVEEYRVTARNLIC